MLHASDVYSKPKILVDTHKKFYVGKTLISKFGNINVALSGSYGSRKDAIAKAVDLGYKVY